MTHKTTKTIPASQLGIPPRREAMTLDDAIKESLGAIRKQRGLREVAMYETYEPAFRSFSTLSVGFGEEALDLTDADIAAWEDTLPSFEDGGAVHESVNAGVSVNTGQASNLQGRKP